MEVLQVLEIPEEGVNVIRYRLTNGTVRELRAGSHVGAEQIMQILRLQDEIAESPPDAAPRRSMLDQLRELGG